LNKCYKYHSTLTTQPLAEAACVSEGGTLVSINSADEQNYVVSLSRSDIWIGLNDRDTEGIYRWESGAAVVYTNWNYGKR